MNPIEMLRKEILDCDELFSEELIEGDCSIKFIKINKVSKSAVERDNRSVGLSEENIARLEAAGVDFNGNSIISGANHCETIAYAVLHVMKRRGDISGFTNIRATSGFGEMIISFTVYKSNGWFRGMTAVNVNCGFGRIETVSDVRDFVKSRTLEELNNA